MQILIGKVEGTTTRKGPKQNKILTLTPENWQKFPEGFYKGVDDHGNEYSVWDVNKNWTLVGIRRRGFSRTTYTREFFVEAIKPESLKVGSVIRNQYGDWAVREVTHYGWAIQGDSGMIALFEGELRFYQLVKY